MGMPPELCKIWNELFEKVRQTKKMQNLVFDFPGANGIETFSLDVVPEFASDGSLESFLGVSTNVTELKKYQEELKRSNAELQQFAYVASHDLQEPLRMVMSYLALLNKKFGDELNPKAKEYMSTATEGAERMKQLVNDLLQYSRIETKAAEFSSVDMNKVAEAVTNDLYVSINEANAEVIVGRLPTVLAD
jgi:light-regulated signal transduction histidine kinase (bacteriophytochrome)